ncbi:ABC transporter permease [Halovivax limisalsi]|uniref:ABC transporter permease n=1 Tax=Halovivax limisalsi TaxID=1453760 RepID=UPI001FFDA583|nr:iron ABC transporter permease [Halovivax limisalsi]
MSSSGRHYLHTLKAVASEHVGRNRATLVGAVVLLSLIYFNILPILVLLGGSFFGSNVTVFEAFTLENWTTLFVTLRPVIFNTVVYAVGATVLTTILSTIIALVLTRTDLPLSGPYYYLLLALLFAPPITWEQVWVFLLGNNGIYTQLLGFDFSIYSLPGMIVVSGVSFVPFGLILLSPIFSNMDNSMEQAAKTSGASLRSILTDITLPIAKPGILMVFVLTLIINLGAFRVPLVIGEPNNINVLATYIYDATNTQPIQYGVAMAAGILLVLMSIPLLYSYYKTLGATEKYMTVSGEGYSRNAIDIGRWRYVVSAVVGVYVLITVVIPVIVMVYASLLPYYVSPLTENVPDFTIEGYAGLFDNPAIVDGVLNSVMVAGLATVFLMAIGLFVVWLIEKTDVPFRRYIDYLSFLPMGIPSAALGVGIMFIYLFLFPIGIYGTIFILVLAYCIRYLPSTIRIVYPSVVQVHDDLIDASKVSGASSIGTIYSIILPLIVPVARALFSVRFAIIFLELPIAMLLGSADTKMVAAVLNDLNSQGQYQVVSALGVVLMGSLLLVAILVHQVGGEHLDDDIQL